LDLNEQNNEIRKKLLNLPKLKASENFLNDLYYKINKIDVKEVEAFQKREKKGFITWFLRNPLTGNRNPWLMPAFGFTIVLFLVFSVVFVLNKNNVQIKNVPVTQFQESNTPVPEPKSQTETLKKDESKDREISENLKMNETAPKLSENKSDDRGKSGVTREESAPPSGRIDEVEKKSVDSEQPTIRGLEKNGLIEQDNASDERKAETKKDSDDKKTGKLSKEKKGDVKTEKEKNVSKDAVENQTVNQGSNEINKDALQNIKDKLEKDQKK
jgi:hypothetical protein